jgi:hypothetical protein
MLARSTTSFQRRCSRWMKAANSAPGLIDALNQAVRRALTPLALCDKLLDSGSEPAPSTTQALTMLLEQDTEKWAKLIRDKRIKAA